MRYKFTAIDRGGATAKGEREAEDEKSLSRTLRAEGFLLTSASVSGNLFSWRNSLPLVSGRVGLAEKMIFARNLAVMVGAGLAMTKALEALEEQSANKKMKAIILRLKEAIIKGVPFSEALAKERAVFGDFFIHMVEAGEVSGKLENSLKLLARQMKRDRDLNAKVLGAMMYPAIVIMTLVSIGTLMLIYVVPALTQTFKELGIQLPPTTRFIIALSDFLVNHSLIAFSAAVFVIFAAYRLLKTKRGKTWFDFGILRAPVFGPLTQKLNAARVSRTLASLIAAGLSITKALEIASRVVTNTEFRESLAGAVAQIEKGRNISQILRDWPRLYPPLVTQMVAVGEETGSLARMLQRIALFYEEEVSNTTKNLSAIIEPLMMIAVGAIVGFFALSIIQPLYSSLAGL